MKFYILLIIKIINNISSKIPTTNNKWIQLYIFIYLNLIYLQSILIFFVQQYIYLVNTSLCYSLSLKILSHNTISQQHLTERLFLMIF